MRRIFPAALARLGTITLILVMAAAGCGRDLGKPEAAALQATPETLFLIQDNEARCVKIGQDGTQRLAAAEMEAERDIRSLASYQARPRQDSESALDQPSPPVQPSDAFRKYLEGDAAEELAAVDAAQVLIQGLLSQVKTEASPELAGAVATLSGAHDQVCLSIRQFRRSTQYQTTLDFAENGYRAAEEKLRPLYTVSVADSQFALRKYGQRLEEARAAARERKNPAAVPAKDYEHDQREWQAAQQLQTQQEVEHEVAVKKFYGRRDGGPSEAMPKLGTRPPPSPEERARAIKAWFPKYLVKAGPVKTALARFLKLHNAGVTDFMTLYDACTALGAADAPLLDDPIALEPPDNQVRTPLRAAFNELQGVSQACQDGQNAEVTIRLKIFEEKIADAAAALRTYALTP